MDACPSYHSAFNSNVYYCSTLHISPLPPMFFATLPGVTSWSPHEVAEEQRFTLW